MIDVVDEKTSLSGTMRGSMAEPNEKLAQSLDQLRALHEAGRRVFRSGELTRTHRERLLRNGFLQQPLQGWLVTSNPSERDGDSTPWFVSFWGFCAAYCSHRFGDRWHLAPNQSVLLHAGETTVPKQAIVMAETGSNNRIDLPHDTAILDVRQSQPPDEDVEMLDGVRVLSPMAALVRAPEALFRSNPVELQVLLSQISDPSVVLHHLLRGGHTRAAGRIAGGLRRIGRGDEADAIIATMRAADHGGVRETDPFEADQSFSALTRTEPPISVRLRALWSMHRDVVISAFPPTPGRPADGRAYLERVDEIYRTDAYHSLSIEGYTVDAQLIDRVRSGGWNPEISEADRQSSDALAARGYWQAFQRVREDVVRVVAGEPAGALVRTTHQDWYREMFQPHVTAGILDAVQLAGYRNGPVYLRGSRHVPPRKEAVRAAMPTLFELLASEASPAVRAVLGHWLMGYVHPFPDGNGRTARFLMNVMLASGGYPWTVIEKGDRDEYLAALESASVDADLAPFAKFLAVRVAAASDVPAIKDEIGTAE